MVGLLLQTEDWTIVEGCHWRGHRLTVPLNWREPASKNIEIYAREVRVGDGEEKPYLLYLQGGPGNLEPYLFFYPFIRPPALGRGEEAASLRRQLGGVLRRHRLCYRRLSHRVVCIVCASQLETLALGLADNNTVAYTNTVDFPGTLDPVDRDARKVSSRCVPWNSSFVVS